MKAYQHSNKLAIIMQSELASLHGPLNNVASNLICCNSQGVQVSLHPSYQWLCAIFNQKCWVFIPHQLAMHMHRQKRHVSAIEWQTKTKVLLSCPKLESNAFSPLRSWIHAGVYVGDWGLVPFVLSLNHPNCIQKSAWIPWKVLKGLKFIESLQNGLNAKYHFVKTVFWQIVC